MKQVTITEAFIGYPHGNHEGSKPRSYKAGEQVEVSETFAKLLEDKKLAKIHAPSVEHEEVHEYRGRRGAKEV